MKLHFHGGIEHVVLYGLSAIVVIDILGLAAGRMVAAKNPMISNAGKALGAVVPYKG